jgi:hypothetical protein
MPEALVYAAEYLAAAAGTEMTLTAMQMYAIATTVVVVGGMAYSNSKANQAKQNAKDQYNSATTDRMQNVVSATAPRDLVLGRVRKAGTLFYRASTGPNSQDLYMAIALAGHEIDAVEEIYLNDVLVALDGSGYVTDEPYAMAQTLSGTGTGPTVTLPASYIAGTAHASLESIDDNHSVWSQVAVSVSGLTATTTAGAVVTYQYTSAPTSVKIIKHLGQPGQAVDADLLAAFPSDWQSANTVQGVAYLVVKMVYNESAFPSGVPSVSAVIRGAKVLNPATGITAWSDNPALLMRHVYQHPKMGKATITAAEDARFIAAANACSASTTYTVGTAAQLPCALYRAGVVAPFGTAPKSLLDDLAQAMGGSWAFAGGEIYLKPGIYSAPVMALTDADLAVVQRNGASESQRPIAISVHKERTNKFNTLKATIWDAGQDYKQSVLTPVTSSALVIRDGAELVQEVTMPAVGYAPQAQHISGVMMRDARDAMVIDLPLKLRAYPLEIFDVVSLTLARYGWTAKTFMVLSRTWGSDGTIQLSLKETTAAITQMDADFLPQGYAVNTNLPKPWIVGDVGVLTITSGTAELMKQTDGTIVSRMRVSWTQIADAAVRQNGQIEVQYRLATSSGAWSSLVVAGEETQAVTSDVADGGIYIVRARAKTSVAVGDWCTQIQHKVLGKTEPPAAFDNFNVIAQPDGTRQYNFGYSTAAPYDWMGAELRYLSGTHASPDWALMTPLQDTSTYYTVSPFELNSPLSGTWTFACRSLDTTGNLSTALVRTVTLGGRRIGTVSFEYYENLDGWLGTKTGCAVVAGVLQSNDTGAWSSAPAAWSGWASWAIAPTSPIYYITPSRDLGVVLTAMANTTIDADGTVTQEIATSADGVTWSGWSTAAATFTTRYLKIRLTVTGALPAIRSFSYTI